MDQQFKAEADVNDVKLALELDKDQNGKITRKSISEVPYRLSEKNVYEMWVGVKRQAENALQFLFATSATEIHKGNDPLSKWIVVVYEDRICFERFGDGVTLESYAPVTPAKAAVYATAIVNGLEPPGDLRPCDKPTD
ncbi:hypothetical protein [Serratia symbiotica]|uniref:Uncharacterized protein n=1 Tax=Serratia symbiotica TaxID=138074 RepID=A0A068Z0C9_9GAMM|nr:hypothetical protein [Serratia symbiotica]QLH62279.1 hypothetical protein SYMBAF_04055 [Serratia symbiotica]CDS55686.1 hypothetical protein SYMBAF_100029 [Serratia symbiotica]